MTNNTPTISAVDHLEGPGAEPRVQRLARAETVGGRPTLICMTPVKNEAWILERFLRCAATWADHVVIADQGSQDGSADIARRFPNVTVVPNPASAYDEASRQRLLVAAARQIPVSGRRILVALDADEVLSANFMTSAEWQRTLSTAAPGTVLRFEWGNILPGFSECWFTKHVPFGFVDDLSPHGGETIHSTRVPVPAGAPVVTLSETKVLHYVYADRMRLESKLRWYQCWERVNVPGKRAVQIYRQYHNHRAPVRRQVRPFRREWIDGYENRGIEMTATQVQDSFWWDRDVLRLIERHGAETFRKVDVWDVDWAGLARRLGVEIPPGLSDPRSRSERVILRLLDATQSRAGNPLVRTVQVALRAFGW